ncbi:hypothetical protein CLAIMM_00720 [Cladophialophora immunda]|nr:hypothetical protein CLAIMM_00720 [Cladophialophora immunda]
MKVFIADIDIEGAKRLAQELNKHGEKVWPLEVNVADWDSQRKGFEAALDRLDSKHVDYVCPIAGVGEGRTFPNRPNSVGFQEPDLTKFEVNMNGFLYTVSLALQQFRRQEPNKHGFRGKVIAAGSVAGFYNHPGIPMCAAAKHAAVGFVRSFGKLLLDEDKITMNIICPNKIRTNINTTGAFDKVEAAGVQLIPMSEYLAAVKNLLGSNDVSGACFEIAPRIGYFIRQPTEFINSDSRISGEMTLELALPLHRPIYD